ncbi:hypothetical protein HRbin11_01923 [bacterium HR11]|nr:hypothetical protein HRbin11_01923 [bacterium HR11]
MTKGFRYLPTLALLAGLAGATVAWAPGLRGAPRPSPLSHRSGFRGREGVT